MQRRIETIPLHAPVHSLVQRRDAWHSRTLREWLKAGRVVVIRDSFKEQLYSFPSAAANLRARMPVKAPMAATKNASASPTVASGAHLSQLMPIV
jgi:hypothetical protein